MPTPAERKALLFLAGVIVLGASVRVVRAARHDSRADTATRQALSRQLAAVDSARRDDASADRRRSSTRGGAGRRRNGKSASRREPDSSSATHREATKRPTRIAQEPAPVMPVDLDVAGESEIEALPRIGPVLARRILEDRAENGPFGSISGFERVRGVGPSLAASLAPRVTFSGTARPSNALADQRLRSPPSPSKSPRRERRNQPRADCARISCRY
jgi:hypothetical protein